MSQHEERNSTEGHSRSQSTVYQKEIPRIFKLTIDCFDEIFEYLSSQDMLTLSQTCKTMQQVVGEYAKANYTEATKLGSNGILSPTIVSKVFSNDGTESAQSSGFNQFIRYIFHSFFLQTLFYLELHNDEFSSVNHLHLYNIVLSSINTALIKNILNKIEIIEIHNCTVDSYLDDTLNHCGNLKRLYVVNVQPRFNYMTVEHWLNKRHPTLDHLEWIPHAIFTSTAKTLEHFFELNPNVRSFSTNYEMLSSMLLLKSPIQLNVLEVKPCQTSDQQMGLSAQTVFGVINQLYERGFFKRLHLHLQNITEDCTNRLFSLKGLEKVCIEVVYRCFNLPLVSNLKELTIKSTTTMINMDKLAEGLVNIERLNLYNTTSSDILPFIRHSMKLHRIYVGNEKCFNVNRPNISALNKERKKLARARKVTIYVSDKLFVDIKWATSNGQMDFELVEIKRSDSYRWDHYC